jgi:hypothetical protein
MELLRLDQWNLKSDVCVDHHLGLTLHLLIKRRLLRWKELAELGLVF